MIGSAIPRQKERGRTAKAIAADMDDVVRCVLDAAAITSEVTVIVLLRDIREKDTVIVRQAAMIVAKRLHCSLSSIGRVMRRDHTTVRYAVEEARANPAFLAERRPHIDAIEAYLAGNIASRQQIRDMGHKLREALGEVAPRDRIAPFPPGADRMLLRGVPLSVVKRAFARTGWIVP